MSKDEEPATTAVLPKETAVKTKTYRPQPEAHEIQWDKLPQGMINIIKNTPPKERYKLRIVRGNHVEIRELVHLVSILNHLLDVAPQRFYDRMKRGEIHAGDIDTAFRMVRDAIGLLEDSMRKLAHLGQIEIRAWKKTDPLSPAT